MRLHELNTLEWDELVTNDPGNLIPPGGGNRLEALCGNPAVSIAWKSIIATLSLSHSFLFFSFLLLCFAYWQIKFHALTDRIKLQLMVL